MKRASTRNVVLSKAMKYVDEETRKEFRDKRLLALEADNYIENETILNAEDDVYDESDDDGLPKKKRAKVAKVKDIRSKWATRPIKSLERILLDNGIYEDGSSSGMRRASSSGSLRGLNGSSSGGGVNEGSSGANTANYLTAAAGPSKLPARHFCSVCGYLGMYSCTRCGSRYCSIKCNTNHKETRCFKFSY